MSAPSQQPKPASIPTSTIPDALTAALIEQSARQTEMMEMLAANQPRKRKSSGDALGQMLREFTYPVFQNGIEAQAHGLSDATIQKAATIASGKYLNDVVEVARTGRDRDQRIFLFYDNRTVDKRMTLKNYFTSFSDLLVKIHAEMAARGVAPVA
jgi:hypothetical protein